MDCRICTETLRALDLIDKVTQNSKIESGGIDQRLKMFRGEMGV